MNTGCVNLTCSSADVCCDMTVLRCVQYRLQKFKMNIANTVVNAENRSLASMATDQLLDLFSVTANRTDEKTSSSAAGRTAESVLGAVEELWDSQQYDNEYNLETFVQNLK